jgi:hypothetical protein
LLHTNLFFTNLQVNSFSSYFFEIPNLEHFLPGSGMAAIAAFELTAANIEATITVTTNDLHLLAFLAIKPMNKADIDHVFMTSFAGDLPLGQ